MILRRRFVFPLLALALAAGCGSNPAPTQAPAAAQPSSATAPAASAVASHDARDASAPSAPQVPPGWRFEKPVVVEGANGMVVTDHGTASKVGRDVLAAGGNAADAAVATAFALAVVFPSAGNIGGGGFAVTRINGQVRALDFRETAPAAASRNMYLDAKGKPNGRDTIEGAKASGVPGSVAGLWELHQQLGSKKKTWAELLAPAIELAEKGFVVDDAYLNTFGKRPDESPQDRLRKFPSTMALYFPNGSLPAKGSIVKNPELAATLKRIAAKGAAGFYEGPTADAIVAQMKAGNGIITKADLKGYKAKWRTPVEFTYRGQKIISMPPPSSGGVTLAMICHILEAYDLGKLGWQSPEELHLVFEAMRRAFAARNEKLGDPDFVKLPLDQLLSEQWATEQRATIKPDKATPSSEIQSGAASGVGPHTTHFSVVDGQGNAVALTTTPNFWYGNGVAVKGAGFILNNEMDDFAAVPGTPNGFGLVQGEANAIAPGKRMLSSMTPTLVVGADGQIKLVVGAAGGPTIITAVFNEISAVLDFGLDPGVAVSGPRFHMQHLPDVVLYEKDGLQPGALKRLEGMGYTMKEMKHIADAPGIGRSGTSWIGVAEPRREGGLAAGY
ncbi:gamma-glutamyltransferase [Pendulispora brunnea]|uniref:Glutathione hydrolase proenzyme n=1 Tax=Pendulispora brunnea TaxID=2905690 RepID=A0ABZ2KEQ4_9BACT